MVVGWKSRLNEIIQNSQGKKFSWGEFDCFTFTNDCYEAVYGETLLDVKGGYDTTASAARYYKKRREQFGVGGVIEFIDKKIDRCASNFIKAGDIVARTEPDGGVFGYALGFAVDMRIAFVSLDGLHTSELLPDDIVWRRQ